MASGPNKSTKHPEQPLLDSPSIVINSEPNATLLSQINGSHSASGAPQAVSLERLSTESAPSSNEISPSSGLISAEKASQDKAEEDDATREVKSHTSAKTTFFPKHVPNKKGTSLFFDSNDETLSNTNANAQIYKEALEESRKRHDRKIKRAEGGRFIVDLSDYDETSEDDYSDLSDNVIEDDFEIADQNTRANELIGVDGSGRNLLSVVRPRTDHGSNTGSRRSSMVAASRSRSRSRSRVRSRSRGRNSRHGSITSRPADEFSPSVSFDTYNNKDATDFSLTLSYKHQDYRSGRLSRTFMCGTDKNQYSENAARWLLRELAEDGDQIVCLRVVEPGSNEKSYRKEAHAFLQQILEKNTHNKRISVVLEFAVGRVTDMIMRMIDIYEPSLLIVGTRGRSSKGWRGLLPGSVSKWSLTYAPIPVVVVKPLDMRQKERIAREKSAHKLKKHSGHGEEEGNYAQHHKAYMDMLMEAPMFYKMAQTLHSDPLLGAPDASRTSIESKASSASSVSPSLASSQRKSGAKKTPLFKEVNGRRIYSHDSSSSNLHPQLPHHLSQDKLSQRNLELGFKDIHLTGPIHGLLSGGNILSGTSTPGSVSSSSHVAPKHSHHHITMGSISTPAVNTAGLNSPSTDSLSPFRNKTVPAGLSPKLSPKGSPRSSPMLSPTTSSTRPGMSSRRISGLDLFKSKSSH